jgi:hypothetical protein
MLTLLSSDKYESAWKKHRVHGVWAAAVGATLGSTATLKITVPNAYPIIL